MRALSSQPSRMLPQRAWAASVPTHLSHDALSKILSPASTPMAPPNAALACPMEKFLGSIYMRRQLHKNIQMEEGLSQLPPPEPGVVQFKAESLQFRCSLNANTLQMLHLKATPTPDYKDQWTLEELQVLEKYFEVKVAGPPYKPGTMTAFNRLLVAPIRILKDFIQLLRLEIVPDRTLKWALQWCLTFSPASPLAAPLGTPAVVIKHNKILVMFQFTRLANNGQQQPQQQQQQQQQPPPPPSNEPATVIVPLLYDTNTSIIQLAELRTVQPQSPVNIAISQMLKRFFEFNAQKVQQGECLLHAAVRELMANLVVPG